MVIVLIDDERGESRSADRWRGNRCGSDRSSGCRRDGDRWRDERHVDVDNVAVAVGYSEWLYGCVKVRYLIFNPILFVGSNESC